MGASDGSGKAATGGGSAGRVGPDRWWQERWRSSWRKRALKSTLRTWCQSGHWEVRKRAADKRKKEVALTVSGGTR